MNRHCLFSLIAFLAALPILASEAPPAPGTPREFTLPARDTLKLDNGLSATFIDYGRVPRTTILAVVRTGRIDEGEDTWLSSVVTEMLKEGTTTRDAAAIARTAAEMGGSLSAGAGSEQTTVGLTVLSEHAVEAMALVGDVLRAPRFPEAELPRIISNLQRSLAVSQTDPNALADQALYSRVYGDHPFGRSYPTPEQLSAYSVDDLRRFHAAEFGARRTHVYVAGRFDRAALEAALRSTFADWDAGAAPRESPPQAQPGPFVQLVDRPGAPQSTLRLAFSAPDPTHAQYMSFTLMNTLLGGSFSSRITTNIREDKGYAYSPSSSLVARRRATLWVQDVDVDTESTAAALTETFNEIRRLAAEAPGQTELLATQNYRAGLFVVQNSSPNGVLGQLAFMDLHGLPAEFLSRWVARLYAVTPADVSRMAADWLDLSRATVVVVGDLARVEASLRALPELRDAEIVAGP